MGIFDRLFKRERKETTKKSGKRTRKNSSSRNPSNRTQKKRIEYCPPDLRGICAGCGKDGRPYFRSNFGVFVSGAVPFAVCKKCGRTWCRKCWKDEGFLTTCPKCGGILKQNFWLS